MPRRATDLAVRLTRAPRRAARPDLGLAPGHVQGNLAILPAALASDFLRFCQLNPNRAR
ncbi:MAG: hypothetical protein M5U08_14050 [Burkholderiales bacterium]|nr:hypothetical protein [Burkholderiales bacterium]